MSKDQKIGVIGVGELGSALIRGLQTGGYDVLANNGTSDRTGEKLKEKGLSEVTVANLEQIAGECGEIFLCIKHGQLITVANELNRMLTQDHLVISCLAQASLDQIRQLLNYSDPLVAKIMTTLDVQQNKGVTAYQLPEFESYSSNARVRKFVDLLSAAGCVFEMETEEQMQLFTIAVGCFPGVMAHILSALEGSILRRGEANLSEYETLLPILLRTTADLLEKVGGAHALQMAVGKKGSVTDAMNTSVHGVSTLFDQGIAQGVKRMKLSQETLGEKIRVSRVEQ